MMKPNPFNEMAGLHSLQQYQLNQQLYFSVAKFIQEKYQPISSVINSGNKCFFTFTQSHNTIMLYRKVYDNLIRTATI